MTSSRSRHLSIVRACHGAGEALDSLPDARQSAIGKAGAQRLKLLHHVAAEVGLTTNFKNERANFFRAEETIAGHSLQLFLEMGESLLLGVGERLVAWVVDFHAGVWCKGGRKTGKTFQYNLNN